MYDMTIEITDNWIEIKLMINHIFCEMPAYAFLDFPVSMLQRDINDKDAWLVHGQIEHVPSDVVVV